MWPLTLYKALKSYGPFDVVHSNMDMLNGINMLIARLLKIHVRISHAHRSGSEKSTTVKELVKKAYQSLMKCMMKSLSTHRIGCSEVAGDYFFGKDNYEILINGIVLPHPCQSLQNAKSQRIKRCRFVTVGRMNTQKNPHRTVSIFSEIIKILPDASLTWCGDGPLRNEIEMEISERGLNESITLMGNTDRVPEVLSNSDYFLFPSLFEGLSLALAEAQAYNLDCFISDTCSKMSDCGKCLYIPLNKTDKEWAEIIVAYIKGDYGCMAINYERLSQFDIKNMAKRLEYIYQSEVKNF